MKLNITPCLWFDREAEEATRYYISIFPDSRITDITYYPEAGQDIHGGSAGSVMVVAFELCGRPFTALNGGPDFKFTEAISLEVACETQSQLDELWTKLGAGGDPSAHQCGWLKDKYGLSWQIVPQGMADFFSSGDPGRAARAMTAMLGMKKLDLAALQRAAEG